ncbi:MAG: class I SAM-dependent methyltransferase [Planctomycetota bacterium]|jgi:predicted O-methyltransferase YrrM
MNPIIEQIFETCRVQDESGNEYELNSHIERCEGELLLDLIKGDTRIRKTLEVGCAYGLSSLFICSALSERKGKVRHIIVDPFQYKHWHGIGILNLKRAGIDFFDLVQEPSEFALPKLAQYESETFDMVFIDGFHTFDHTLLDIFYANRLIRVGGYIVVDDCGWPSIAKAISYILNYPAYQLWSQVRQNVSDVSLKRKLAKMVATIIPKPIWGNVLPLKVYNNINRAQYSSMVVLKKIDRDERLLNWFEDF